MRSSSSASVLKQIKITERQQELLDNEAQITGGSVASVIRDLIVEHYRAKGML